jgi:hypothetical protein
MPQKKLKVDFFTVEMPSNTALFSDVLLSIAASSDDSSRWLDIRHSKVCLQHASSTKNLIEGELVRLRLGEGAVKGRTADINTEEIQLEKNEALAELSAFLFHIPTATLAIQRNRIGVSASTMALYCEEKSDIRPILMAPIIQEEVLKKVARVGNFRTFSFRVAGAKNATFLRESGWSGSQVLDIMKTFQAPVVDITLSMSRQRKGGLAHKPVLDAVKQLYGSLRGIESPVEKLVVTGKSDHDEMTVLDLLKDCIREETSLEYTSRVPQYDQRRLAVKEAWMRRRDEIVRMNEQEGG